MPYRKVDVVTLRRPGLIKICGVRETEHALVVAEAGADVLGLNFAPSSKRRVSIENAVSIVSAVRHAFGDGAPLSAGIFVDVYAENVNQIASVVGLDVVQLHDPAIPASIERIERPVIRPISPPPGSSPGSVASSMAGQRLNDDVPALFMLDAHDPVLHGGTGRRADWHLARDLARDFPLLLAGGLTPENVAQAIAQVRPLGVDVASGVETDGVKDPEKIRAFIANAREAFAALNSDIPVVL
jgi:phosphoribosylanthranilate isomerase